MKNLRVVIISFIILLIIILTISCNLPEKDFHDEQNEKEVTVNDKDLDVEKVVKIVNSIPILMYHEIKELPDNGERLTGLFVSPDRFNKQLDALKREGYNTVTMQELYEHWNKGNPIKENPVVLTFDDGYESVYKVALDALLERNMVGTFYLHTSAIGTRNSLTEDMIKEMHNSGMEIASHSITHSRLDKDNVDLKSELLESKNILESIIESEVNHFSYPFGGYNSMVKNEVEKYGYLTAVTVKEGKAKYDQNIYALHRITVDYHDKPDKLLKKIKD